MKINGKSVAMAPQKSPKKRGRPPGSGKNQNVLPFDLQSTSTTGGNQFSVLNSDLNLSDQGMETASQSNKRRRVNKNLEDHQMPPKASPRPPPINISGKSYKEVQQILASTNISNDDYQTKLSAGGIRVFAKNDEVHKQINAKLKEVKSKFFTHQLRAEQTTKIVLHGLYKMSENELQEKLQEMEIKPSKVKTLTVRKQQYSDHCVYLLHFPKSQKMKISALREIKAIDRVIVRWEYFKNKKNGPIQCSNCMQYGHGSQCCFLDPICVRCGGDHPSQKCEHLKDSETNKIPDEKIKCGLCQQNHTANYSKCQKRKEFIERQTSYRSRTQRRNKQPHQPQQQRNYQFKDAPQLNDFDFPAFPTQTQQVPNFRRRETEPAQQPSNDSDLFSPSELMIIMAEIIKVTINSKTKVDQIIAVSNIVNKYCNNGFTR